MTDIELDEFIDNLYEMLGAIGAKGPASQLSRNDDGSVDVNVRFTLDQGQ